MSDNSFKQPIQEAKQELNSIIALLERVQSEIIETSKIARANTLKGFGASSPNDVNSELKKQQELIDKLNKELAEQRELTKRLTTAKINLNKATSEEVVNQRQLRKNSDLSATSVSKLVGAYSRLIAQQKIQKKILQDLIISQGKNSTQTIRAQKEYDKLTKKVNKANKATSNFNNTGLGGMVKGFGNLLSAFGLVSGVTIIADLIRGTFELTKEINALDFAMKAVIKDHQELGQTQEWLIQITNDFGAELVSTTKRYIKFRAAAQQAGLSAKETQKIFGTMTKAAGVLGLKTDELTGVYLALEQMISKGKITTEELRRQLGERLPGAMDIMAKAVGVTTAELDSMMKKGLVITKDVLPAFAREVERAYSIENVTRVETLVAAQIRLQNSWTNLVKGFEEGNDASKKLMVVFDFLADNLESLVGLFVKAIEIFILYKTIIIASTVATRAYTVVTVSLRVAKIALTRGVVGLRRAMAALNIVMTANPWILLLKGIVLLGVTIFAFRDNISGAVEEQELLNKAMEDGKESAEEYASELEGRLFDALNSITNKTNELVKATDDLNEQDMIRAQGAQERINAIVKEQSAVGDMIVRLIQQRSAFENGSPMFARYTEMIKQQDELYKSLTDRINSNNEEVEKNTKLIEGSVGWLKKQIKGREGLIELSADVKEIRRLQLLNDLDKLRLDYLLGQNQALKARKEVVPITGSKAFLERLIKINNQRILGLSLDNPAVIQTKAMNKVLEDFIDNMTKGGTVTDNLTKSLANLELPGKIPLGVDIPTDDIKLFGEALKEIIPDISGTFGEMFDIDMSKFDFILDSIDDMSNELFSTENIGAWADLSKELIGGVLDASLQRYEIEIQEAQRSRDLILENDLASDEQKKAARKKFDEEERKIKTKKAKEERKNNLIKIAIDTAVGVAKVVAQTGIIAPALIPTIIGIGLAQAAIVASQPLPKFEKGTMNAPGGWAIVDEKRPEVHTDRLGRIKSMGSSDGANLRMTEKGDKIYKSHDEFFNQYNQEEIQKAVWELNMSSNGDALNQNVVDRSLLMEISGMRKDMDSMGEKMIRLASRPIKNEVKIITEDKSAY